MNFPTFSFFFFSFLLGLFVSCKTESTVPEPRTEIKSIEKKENDIPEKKVEPQKTDLAWKGTIGAKTPVFIHFQLEDSVLLGEIVYLNTKNKTPIKLIGQQMKGGVLRILEFEKSGNVTGIITGIPYNSNFKGEWFSPKSRKTLNLDVSTYDTLIPSIPIFAEEKNILGTYDYQFGTEGSTGNLTIQKRKNGYELEIACFTAAPASNMAIVKEKDVKFNKNSLFIKTEGDETCHFRVRYFNGFAVVNYTNGDCSSGYFGHNAHIEGIFLKTK